LAQNKTLETVKSLQIESSYKKNALGITLYNFVRCSKPRTVVEFGSFQGYSSVCIGLALRDNGFGSLHAYDLWENYQYKSFPMELAVDNVKLFGLQDIVSFDTMDFYDWLKNPADFDLLHLDISNNGYTILDMYSALRDRIQNGTKVLFEGGSEERDQEKWMIQYGKRPIRSVLAEVPFSVLNEDWPSLSVIEEEK
jgi:predicted O-methyltransferase YrrM